MPMYFNRPGPAQYETDLASFGKKTSIGKYNNSPSCFIMQPPTYFNRDSSNPRIAIDEELERSRSGSKSSNRQMSQHRFYKFEAEMRQKKQLLLHPSLQQLTKHSAIPRLGSAKRITPFPVKPEHSETPCQHVKTSTSLRQFNVSFE